MFAAMNIICNSLHLVLNDLTVLKSSSTKLVLQQKVLEQSFTF